MSLYYVFAIKCTKDSSYYLGVSTKKVANSISYMLSQHELDNTKYVRLAEHIKKHGRNSFICHRLPLTFENKESAESFVFNKLNELDQKGKMLNDSIINPARVKCEKCGNNIRVDFMEKHLTTYCVSTVFQEVYADL